MNELSEQEYYEGVVVDLIFERRGPMFGDLVTICGYENPHFPPPRDFRFDKYENLQFSQVDDYFGVQSLSGEGDDVAIWLCPIINGEVVNHHPGPFDGLRISYNVLRNPIQRSNHFLLVLETLSKELPVTMSISLGAAKEIVTQINEYWLKQGVTPGSDEALEIDY
jgi:hypothetical protein